MISRQFYARPHLFKELAKLVNDKGLRFSVFKRFKVKSTMDSDTESEQHFSSGDVTLLDSKFDPPGEYFESPRLNRRQSTLEDEQRMIMLLQEILEDQNKNISSWLVEVSVF